MHRDQLPIAEPCHADWGTMSGDARKRFCGSCTKHVHDLSSLTEPEAVELLETTPDLCVRYAYGADGTMIHAAPRRSRIPRVLAFGAALLGSVPAFASGAVAQPSSGTEPSLIERVWRRAQEAAGVVPEVSEPAPLGVIEPRVPHEPQVTMGAPPPQIERVLGRVARPPTIVLPPPVEIPVIPLPAPGESVIPEVEQALREQSR